MAEGLTTAIEASLPDEPEADGDHPADGDEPETTDGDGAEREVA